MEQVPPGTGYTGSRAAIAPCKTDVFFLLWHVSDSGSVINILKTQWAPTSRSAQTFCVSLICIFSTKSGTSRCTETLDGHNSQNSRAKTPLALCEQIPTSQSPTPGRAAAGLCSPWMLHDPRGWAHPTVTNLWRNQVSSALPLTELCCCWGENIPSVWKKYEAWIN